MDTAMTDYLRTSGDCNDLQTIAAWAEDTIRQFADLVMIGIFIIDEGGLIRVMPKGHNLPDFFAFQKKENYIVGEAMDKRCVTHHPLTDYEAEDAEELMKMGGRSILSVPVFFGEEVFAVMVVVLRGEEYPGQELAKFCSSLCGFLAVQMRNVLQNQELQRQLREYRDRTNEEILFHGMLDLIFVLDKRGYFKRVNPAFEACMGYSAKELFCKPVTAFIHPEDRGFVEDVLNNIEELEIMRGFCHRFIDGQGKVIYLELNVRYVPEKDDVIAMAKNVTIEREMELRNRMLERSIELEKMKTEFFSNISHEFKTPVNIIMSAADLLKLKIQRNDGERYDAEYRKFFAYMEQNSFKLLRLINNLIDCTKLADRGINLLAQDCEIVPLVRQIAETTESYAATHGVEICFDSSLPEDFSLYCDQDKIDRILLNLISNSIKYARKDGKIIVSITANRDYVRLAVADNGQGISEKMLPHIFERFKVYEEGFVKSCEGTGVGLSIVKGLAELHGGMVTVESRQGKGSRFTVSLSRNLKKVDRENQVTMAGRQQDEDLFQSRLRMEMSNIS